MKKMSCFLLMLACCTLLSAQKIGKSDKKQLQALEDSAKIFGNDMLEKAEWEERFLANDKFTKTLAKALKIPNSFWYPFDSLQTISKLYAPDTAFRIFTWEVAKDLNEFVQRGAIQMRTTDGSLKLFPLFDASAFTYNPTDSARNKSQWIGALYYKIVVNENKGIKYYTLLGFDNNEARSNKKWMEVLWFDKNAEPVFGGAFFQYKNDNIKPKQPAYRFCIEYKKDAKVRFNYDEEMQCVVFDHLISEGGDETNKASLIPDGSYETFTWKNGKWVHNPNLAYQKVNMQGVDPLLGNAPAEMSLLDENGNIDQKKLNEQNKKNLKLSKQKNTKNKYSKIQQ